MDNDTTYDELVAEDSTATATTNGSREEQLARLDQMQRDIAAERERLNRPEPEVREQPDSRNEAGQRRERPGSVREVDLPDLEAKVTESQREAWRLGYKRDCRTHKRAARRPRPLPSAQDTPSARLFMSLLLAQLRIVGGGIHDIGMACEDERLPRAVGAPDANGAYPRGGDDAGAVGTERGESALS